MNRIEDRCSYGCKCLCLSIGDIAVTNIFWFEDGKLAHVSLTFDSEDYDYLCGVFIEKYGPPRNRAVKQLQNRMEGKFTNEVLTWEGGKMSISISKYGDKTTEGNAGIGLRGFWERKYKNSTQGQKESADDF
jgi:hypothetical protein